MRYHDDDYDKWPPSLSPPLRSIDRKNIRVVSWVNQKLMAWFLNCFGNDWSWYGDFYNLFTIFARLMFSEKHCFLHSRSLFHQKVFYKVIWDLLNDDDSLDFRSVLVVAWAVKKIKEKNFGKKRSVQDNKAKSVIGGDYPAKKMSRVIFVGKLFMTR